MPFTAPREKETVPLAALSVLDLADETACFCSKLLADMGAQVLKIESPGGDDSRWIGPFWGKQPNPEKSLSFWYTNTSKLGVTLNLESTEGQDIFLRLASKADVVVETFPPGYLKKIGLHYEAMNKNNRFSIAFFNIVNFFPVKSDELAFGVFVCGFLVGPYFFRGHLRQRNDNQRQYVGEL